MPLRLTFRLKLLLIVGAAVLSLVGILASDAVIRTQEAQRLTDVEQRLVPKLELGPRLKTDFERLGRTMLDAVAAEDMSALNEAAERRAAIFELIAQADAIIEPSVAASLRWAISDYYQAALDISQRMIGGETGERLVEDVTYMQARQAAAQALIHQATMLEKDELARALSWVRDANQKADRVRFGIAFAGLMLVAALSFWVGKSMLKSLANLSDGFGRFATGDLSHQIPVTNQDELGDVSREANQMADSLRRLAERRERQNWLDNGRAELSSKLAGAMDVEDVTARALAFLSQRIGAVASALYLEDQKGFLALCGHYVAGDDYGAAPLPGFAKGEGLVGQAFLSEEMVLIDDPPAGYLSFRSGLTDGHPRSLLLVPLTHFGHAVGVLEFALLNPSDEKGRELLAQAGAAVASGLVVANHATSLRTLLTASRAQAEQLASQEAELRHTNQELLTQQEELRRANSELEEQRGVLHRQNSQLEETQRALEENAGELAQVSAYKSQFLANMSHELRTPLNSMLLLSQILSQNEPRTLTAKQVEYAEIIHSAGSDLLKLINQVLDLSKIEAGKQHVELRTVELTHFVRFVQRQYEALATNKGLTLSSELDPEAPLTFYTDVERVERVLSNLIGNAIKFTERGEVRLRITRPPPGLAPLHASDGAVAFVVSDTGVGIATVDPEQVFAPFEQVDAGGGNAGTGLGLAIARESARLLGGDLVFESHIGQGTSFIFVLPEVTPDKKAVHDFRLLNTHKPLSPTIADDRDRLAMAEPYLLIIEDDPVLAEQLADIGRARRLKVVVVGSGKEGMAFAREHLPTGIVLDVKLPDIEGWTVMERLKRDPVTKNVPVHFVSGVHAAQRGLALGAVGYLVKPARHEELVGVIQALAPGASRSVRILVAEANDAEGADIVALLRDEKLEADHAGDAQTALGMLEQQMYGCVILDLNLPGVDGLDLLETVREKMGADAPHVVIHTARALTREEARQLEVYSEAVILKGGHSVQRLMEEVRLFVRHVTNRSNDARVAAPASATPPDALKGLVILLVEDDMRTVYVISALLQGKGAQVLVAVTGKEALEILEQRPHVDGVLMDIMMPEMDGYEAMRRVRKIERFARLPVIALTAKAMKGERERCLEAGATDYLTKPIDAETLISKVARWMHHNVGDVS